MELKVIFLGVLKYQDKETKESKYRVSYVLADKKAIMDSANFKGIQDNAYYTDKSVVWEKLQSTDALTEMTFIVESRPSLRNPLKNVTEITSIITKHETIELL